ncbi:hypothetical protein Cgig2_012338 [Carnegiea gigantea]|uniref:H(+)-transporting two-sector ATPase n=1 Tax=Carnegiea gigantea TaxID=171969 RepID=A0A9Q1Q5D3_9CARY|nr:hypothetical protein Cgig2_012338 [Carnegiea gigantea]
MDIAFPLSRMPNIYNALVVKGQDTVGQQINGCGYNFYRRSNAKNRSYRYSSSFKRFSCRSTPKRLFNIPEESVDNLHPIDTRTICSIHRSMLAFTQLDAKLSMSETELKGVGVGETALIVKLINNIPKAQWGISIFGEVRNNAFPVGHQPPLSTKMGSLEEKISSTKQGSITLTQVVYVPAENLTDPAPTMTFAHYHTVKRISH